MEGKKLYRSKTDKMLAGVCGGLGQYLGIDSTVVRLIFALLFVTAGSGLLLYIILALIMPLEP
jgi:phage shock protein PspC (stress-responsive transcriptional regulator)